MAKICRKSVTGSGVQTREGRTPTLYGEFRIVGGQSTPMQTDYWNSRFLQKEIMS